jgi:hypothetical protein
MAAAKPESFSLPVKNNALPAKLHFRLRSLTFGLLITYTMFGAGGTKGGIGQFFLGLVMFITGGYLLLSSIIVTNDFSLGYGLFHIGSFSVTSGIILIPFMIGVGMIFYNSKNFIGWILAAGALLCMIVGVIVNTRFVFKHMTALELIIILVLLVGGAGLFLRSLRSGK